MVGVRGQGRKSLMGKNESINNITKCHLLYNFLNENKIFYWGLIIVIIQFLKHLS